MVVHEAVLSDRRSLRVSVAVRGEERQEGVTVGVWVAECGMLRARRKPVKSGRVTVRVTVTVRDHGVTVTVTVTVRLQAT